MVFDSVDFVEGSAIDGAAYTALKAMFKGRESFEKVQDFVLKANGQDRASDGFDGGFKMGLFGSLDEHETESFKLGEMACKDVINEFEKDGFDILGTPGKGRHTIWQVFDELTCFMKLTLFDSILLGLRIHLSLS